MTITARGVIARTPGGATTVEEFTIDDPGPNEVLVRIVASGVCHTDLGVKSGTYGTDGFPFLMGHEGAGIIEKIGEGVDNVQVGDSVILAWRAPCGKCRFCLRGRAELLRRQPQRGKADAHHRWHDAQSRARYRHLLHPYARSCTAGGKVAPELPAAQMSLIGCGVMTGVGAALYSANVRPGSLGGGFRLWRRRGLRADGCTSRRGDHDHRRGYRPAQTRMGEAVRRDPHCQLARRQTPWRKSRRSPAALAWTTHLKPLVARRRWSRRCLPRSRRDVRLYRRPRPRPDARSANCRSSSIVGGSVTVSWYGNCLPTRDFPLLANWYAQGQLNLDAIVTQKITLE